MQHNNGGENDFFAVLLSFKPVKNKVFNKKIKYYHQKRERQWIIINDINAFLNLHLCSCLLQ